MARTKNPDRTNVKSERVEVRLTESEKAILKALAEKQNLTISEYVVKALIKS
jgi:uncharacterized protein (DUF1778 family)